jgi:membrane protease YdiL (CAAX protease family)
VSSPAISRNPAIARAFPRVRLTMSGLVTRVVAVSYVAAIILIDVLLIPRDITLGLIAHGILLPVLAIHGATLSQDRARAFFWLLSMVPISRIVMFSLPLAELPPLAWHWAIGAIMLLTGFVAARAVGLSAKEIGLTVRLRWLWLDLLGAPLGLVLGFLGYLFVRPPSWVTSFLAEDALYPIATLVVAAAFVEELVYRGLIVRSAYQVLGLFGCVCVSAIYCSALFGAQDGYLAVVFGANLIFALLTLRTRSLLGSVLGHAGLNLAMFVLAPLEGPTVFPAIASAFGCLPVLEGFCH